MGLYTGAHDVGVRVDIPLDVTSLGGLFHKHVTVGVYPFKCFDPTKLFSPEELVKPTIKALLKAAAPQLVKLAVHG